MADMSFDDFVRREQQEPINWQVEKKAWLQHLEELYAQVEGFLKPYVDAGNVVKKYRSVNLNEEYFGSYSAKEMIIIIGSKTIKLEPMGALILGSKGRVDVAGPLARAQLLLLDNNVKSMSQLVHVSESNKGKKTPRTPRKPPSDVKWVWKIVTRPPRREIIEINEKTFLNLLVEISNGQSI